MSKAASKWPKMPWDVARSTSVPRDSGYRCQFEYGSCNNHAVRIICWDSNVYENDKYGWACEECAQKNEIK